jgi:catechol 2,3-dioxygenase
MNPIDPTLNIAAVELAVSDLPRSLDFYERILGLPLIDREEHRARLGTDPERPALILTDIVGATPPAPNSTGLFHVAWLHPSRSSLADSVRRVAGARWPLEGASDHGVSEALYLSDPDGLGIEIYADRPRAEWERLADGAGVRMYTLPLDLENLLAQSTGEPTTAMAPGPGIGHVHLKVADVPRASAFYRDGLGFEEQAQIPSAAFVSAGGYHHHVGLNSWQSHGGSPEPDSAPGLRRVEFALADDEALDHVERALADTPAAASGTRAEDGAVSVRDPDGQLLRFVRR